MSHSKSLKESIENDLEMVRLALENGDPRHIHQAVTFLKKDLSGWDHKNIGDLSLYHRANHLLSTISQSHLG